MAVRRLLLLIVEAAGLALFALALVVTAGVAFCGGFAAGVAFLAAFMVFGISGGCGAEAAESEDGEDELEGFHNYGSSFLAKVDAWELTEESRLRRSFGRQADRQIERNAMLWN